SSSPRLWGMRKRPPMLAYDDIYDVYGRPSQVFRQPYAATVPGLFDMEHFFDDVLAGLPPTSRELLTASWFRAVSGNPAEGHAPGRRLLRGTVGRRLAGTGCRRPRRHPPGTVGGTATPNRSARSLRAC